MGKIFDTIICKISLLNFIIIMLSIMSQYNFFTVWKFLCLCLLNFLFYFKWFYHIHADHRSELKKKSNQDKIWNQIKIKYKR